jgi:hypothetical protein
MRPGSKRVPRSPQLVALFLVLESASGSAFAMPDLKFTLSRNFGPYRTDTTTYLKADRKRVDELQHYRQQLWLGGPAVSPRSPRVATITRCDLRVVFQINLDDREYTSIPIPKPLSDEERKARVEELRARGAQGPQLQSPAQPNLSIEITTNDTGERKQMFGYAARHVITTDKRIPLESAVSSAQEQVTDGWYIDLDTSISCDPPRQPGAFAVLLGGVNGKVDSPTFKVVGRRETGFAVATTRSSTLLQPDGSRRERTRIDEARITAISTEPLSSAVFEIPRGFREVREIRRIAIMPWWGRALVSLHKTWSRFESVFVRAFRRLSLRGFQDR